MAITTFETNAVDPTIVAAENRQLINQLTGVIQEMHRALEHKESETTRSITSSYTLRYVSG